MLELIKDYRLGGIEKLYISNNGDHRLQIPDEIRKCVVFICCATTTGRIYLGTGFFIGEHIEDTGFIYTYLVTAKHIIEKAKSISIDNTIILRMNLKDNAAQYISCDISSWLYHPNEPNTDIAVLPFYVPSNEFDYRVFPVKSFLTNEIINTDKVGIGDDVFISGLFIRHYGSQRNLPIIRVGNIVAMMEEPIQTKNGLTDAYLIESRSIGGLSGSPVFVNLGLHRFLEGKVLRLQEPKGYRLFLLGLIRGHWEWEDNDYDVNVKDNTNEETINMGIAIVTPATKILDIINQPKLLEMKMKDQERIKEKNLPVEDANATQITKEDFHNLIKKAAQPIDKTNESDSTSSGT